MYTIHTQRMNMKAVHVDMNYHYLVYMAVYALEFRCKSLQLYCSRH